MNRRSKQIAKHAADLLMQGHKLDNAADTIARFYKRLVAAGVPPEQAGAMSSEWMKSAMKIVERAKANGE